MESSPNKSLKTNDQREDNHKKKKLKERHAAVMMCCLDWMQRLSRSLIRFETQDIKTQPLFNHNFSLDFFPFNNWLNSWRSQGTSLFQTACSSSLLNNYWFLLSCGNMRKEKDVRADRWIGRECVSYSGPVDSFFPSAHAR